VGVEEEAGGGAAVGAGGICVNRGAGGGALKGEGTKVGAGASEGAWGAALASGGMAGWGEVVVGWSGGRGFDT